MTVRIYPYSYPLSEQTPVTTGPSTPYEAVSKTATRRVRRCCPRKATDYGIVTRC
jgi:hypothetical protein